MLLPPKISIITPSYNQGQFIEDTILSVLGQNYLNLEYIIIDGGSTDDTVSVIKKYEQHLAYWVSEKDKGQSEAINKGFAKSTGDILLWLNSDDMLMPNVLHKMAAVVTNADAPSIFFGNCIHFQSISDAIITRGSDVVEQHKKYELELLDYIIQPSSFWTRQVWDIVGSLREDLHFGFDWEWFLRAKKLNIRLTALSSCYSLYRIHESHKTGSGGNKRQEELYKIYAEYAPENAVLYKQIIGDRKLLPFGLKVKSKILRTLFPNQSYGAYIKRLKPKKYHPYSVEQIDFCCTML